MEIYSVSGGSRIVTIIVLPNNIFFVALATQENRSLCIEIRMNLHSLMITKVTAPNVIPSQRSSVTNGMKMGKTEVGNQKAHQKSIVGVDH